MTETIDFFVAGGTLRANDPSYVTRPADHDLLQQLRAGEFCYVLTPRQMGKSSLMVRTAQRLRAEGTLVAVIDLTSIGTGSSELSADQWYLGLLSRVRTQLRLATDVQAWWGEHAALGVAQRFTLFLHDVLLTECSESIVILIDEIDSTLNLNFRDDFFAAIRAVYNERATDPSYQRLTFALFGVATPTDLIQDRERTPFNIGRRIDLNEFTLADAQPLHDGLAANFSIQADAILQRIFYWTNGHPYLTQKLCQVLQSEDARDEDTTVTNYVDSAVQSIFLSEEGRKDPNLTFVQDRVATSPDHEKRRMLQLYRRVQRNDTVLDDNRSPIQNRLELYGLVGVAGGRLQVRNRIYWHVFDSVWITSMMPADQRQRRAVLTAVGALFLMLIVTLYIYLQPATECAVYQERFRNFENSNVRLSALSDLIDQGCQSVAQDLFYDLERAEQEALFLKLDNWPNERNRLATVIDSIYRTLDTDPKQDVALMKAWYVALEWAEIENGNALHSSIKYWKEGRDYAVKGNYQAALIKYGGALTAISNDNHAILRYDMALAYIELADYDNALAQLDAILRIADAMPVTPTPTISPTPSNSPTSPTTPTATPSRNDTVAANEASIPTKIVTDSMKLPTATITIELSVTRERVVGVAASETITTAKNQGQYQKRFRNADTIRDTVRTLMEDNPTLLLHYQENIVDYQHLAALDIGVVSVAAVSTFTPTSLVATATSVRTQLTPLSIVTLAETPTRLPIPVVSYVYRLKIDGCAFAPIARRQTGFRVQGVAGIVTALHGVADCTTFWAVTDQGEVFTDLIITAADIVHDVALLSSPEFDSLTRDGLAISPLSNDEILVENIRIVGYPLGLDKQSVDTIQQVRAISVLDDVIPDSEESVAFIDRHSPQFDIPVLDLQAQLLPGHAGAPLLDHDDQVIGVGNGGLRRGTVNRSWAIPWHDIRWQSATTESMVKELKRLAQTDPVLAFSFSSTYPTIIQPTEQQKIFEPNQYALLTFALPLKREPLMAGLLISQLSEGEVVQILDGPDTEGENVWWQVKHLRSERTGWIRTSDDKNIFVAPLPQFFVNDYVEMIAQDRRPLYTALNNRKTAAAIILPGEKMVIRSGPEAADGYVWYEVTRESDGVIGWIAFAGYGNVFLELLPAPPATHTPTPPPTFTATSVPPPTPTDTVTPTPSSAVFRIGDFVEAAPSLRIRAFPGLRHEILESIKQKELFVVTEGPVTADNYTWWKLSELNGTVRGWSAYVESEGDFSLVLAPYQTPTPPPANQIPESSQGGDAPQSTPAISSAATIEILDPKWSDSRQGWQTVRWRYKGELQPGQGFDLILWYVLDQKRKPGLTDARLIAEKLQRHSNGEYSVLVNFSAAEAVKQYCDAKYLLSVTVVELDPYKRIGPESDPVQIQVAPLPGGPCGN